MANLSVRNLDEKAYERLRMRAIKHRISMEEEVRQIIYQAVSIPEKVTHVFQKYFGKKNGVDLGALNQRTPHEPMDFDK